MSGVFLGMVGWVGFRWGQMGWVGLDHTGRNGRYPEVSMRYPFRFGTHILPDH